MASDASSAFAIGVRYLTGYAVASDGAGRAEWPPAPARLFMALVAAHHHAGGDPAERAALRALEQLAPPDVIASGRDVRPGVKIYVPPDEPGTPAQYRPRQEKQLFPRARPHDDTVRFVYRAAGTLDLDALDRLCGRVARLGHSSSLVQVWVEPAGVPASDATSALRRYAPDDAGDVLIRVVNPGTLDYLDAQFGPPRAEREVARAAAERADAVDAELKKLSKPKRRAADEAARLARVAELEASRPTVETPPPPRRPNLSGAARYALVQPRTDAAVGAFEPGLIVLRLSPKDTTFRRLAAASAPEVCARLREAVLSHAGDAAPEVLTGHASGGGPSGRTHAAYVPLPFVGHAHADGHLLGVAVALPRRRDDEGRDLVPSAEWSAALRAIRAVEELKLGRLGVWAVEPIGIDDERQALDANRWTAAPGGSARWATVTPVALDRHAKAKDPAAQRAELADLVRRACADAGLPEPVGVRVGAVSHVLGAPAGREFPRLPRKDGSQRRQVHAAITFGRAVLGPVLLGAGRYRGWGVCVPMDDGGDA